MTLWALVSDIHGNRKALDEIERRCAAAGVQRYACLGDVIGRGDPAACVAWVRAHAAIALVGNRDLDHLARVPQDLRDVVLGWANEAQAADFIVSHGESRLHRVLNSAAERDGFRRAKSYMEERGAALWLFGHTHRSRCWRLGDVGATEIHDTDVELDPRVLYVVNVGTAGLPLPGRGAASFTLYDDATRVVRRVVL